MSDAENCDQTFVPLPQSDAYATAAAACGAKVLRVDLGIGRALVVQRGRTRLISRGPVWEPGVPDAAKRAALCRLARWPGLTLVTPEDDLTGFGLIPLVTPMSHALWDLAGDPRAAMDRKWRNHLNAAERKGFVLDRDRPGALDRLIAVEAAQRKLRGYRTLPPTFSRALPTEALRLWEWRHDREVAAAMCFVRHGRTASYHLSWAGPPARARAIHGLMLWRAAEALAAEGVRWLDLGSVNSEQAIGLARFKCGTGAALKRIGSTLLVLPG